MQFKFIVGTAFATILATLSSSLPAPYESGDLAVRDPHFVAREPQADRKRDAQASQDWKRDAQASQDWKRDAQASQDWRRDAQASQDWKRDAQADWNREAQAD
jgi:Ni/Co efflux regulator RcnB